MNSAAPHVTQDAPSEESPLAGGIALALFPVALYVAVWVLHWPLMSVIGFTVAVPGLIGWAVASVVGAIRRTTS